MEFDAQHGHLVSQTRAFVDGQPADAAALMRFARSGYGHYTTMQVRAGAVRGLDVHLARLQEATRVLFDAALDADALRAQMRCALSGMADASLRISIGAANFTARAMPSPARLEVLMLVDPPAPEIIAPVRLMSMLHSRYLPQLKHGGSFDVMHLRRDARMQGFDDALLLTQDGFVAEGATFNIGFFHHDALLWPQAPQLQGSTMQMLSQAFRAGGGQVTRQPITRHDIAGLTAGFCCNSGGLWPIAAIDAHPLPDSESIVERLRSLLATVEPQAI